MISCLNGIPKDQPLWCRRLCGAVLISPFIFSENFYHREYPPPQPPQYLLPELVMASRMMLALAPARNRASYSTLINWYLEECRVLDLYFVGCSIVNRGCRCQTVVNKLPLTLSKICKSRIFVFESSLVNKSCGKPSTRHVFADSHQCQLRSETVSHDMVTTS